MEAALASAAKQPRWTGHDCVCLGMTLFVLINVVMCLWVAVTSESTAHSQAKAVFLALENASTIEFNLTMQTNGSADLLNVTGQLHPRFSECLHRLHFDGRMEVSSTNSSDVFVLTNHRGYRLRTSSANVTCLTTLDVPPLHTLADTVHSAFRPVAYSEFSVNCKPLQFTFYDTPFAVCAEDWLRSRLKEDQHPPPMSNLPSSGEQHQDPVLVIHGKQSALTVKVLSDTTADANQPFEKLEHCEFLEAPMTSGESCSNQSMHCPGPHILACKKREGS